jgi:SagB-type dehydrogenase family enzyme
LPEKMLDADDRRSLAFLYHLNSGPVRADVVEAEGYTPESKEIRSAGERISLPSAPSGSSLLELIGKRRSCRSFSDKPLRLDDIASILAGAYGITGAIWVEEGVEANGRAVPSAGALYPLELYVAARNIESLAEGMYHYHLLDHALEPLPRRIDWGVLAAGFIAAPFLDTAGGIVLVTAVFDRTLHKYGARGYRFVLLEAGHLAQNICLIAGDRGLASVCLGGFIDGTINAQLELDAPAEATIYCVALGHTG